MKKLIVLSIVISASIFACNQTSTKEENEAKENASETKTELKDAEINEKEDQKAKETNEWNRFKNESDSTIASAENDLKNIFNSYYQGTISEKVNDLGVGLGLNLCREIIELFGGTIDVQSKEGKGTTFKFNLIVDHTLKK